MLPVARFVVRTFAAVALAGASLPAQDTRAAGPESPRLPGVAIQAHAAIDSTPTRAAPGPRADALAAGVRLPLAGADPAPAPRRGDTSQNRALMIVGGAALLVGAIIGHTSGTIFMVGGAVIGLYGLYKFLE